MRNCIIGTGILLTIIASACNQKGFPRVVVSPQQLIIQNLVAENLSEDLGQISTGNDEIIMCVHYLSEERDTLFLLQQSVFDAITLSISENLLTINDTNSIPRQTQYLVFSLIELDNWETEAQIVQVLNEEIPKINFGDALEEKFRIDKLLGDDDFLGFRVLSISQLAEHSTHSIVIEGNHLLDAYEYVITIVVR